MAPLACDIGQRIARAQTEYTKGGRMDGRILTPPWADQLASALLPLAALPLMELRSMKDLQRNCIHNIK